MPLCITCTHPTLYLYTVYRSAHNLRLEQCTACNNFADPYVEHDSLTLLLDLILLKRAVYRHLLYNRGVEPRRVGMSGVEDEKSRVEKERRKEKLRWLLILRLGSALVFVDAFIRWTYLNHHKTIDITPWPRETVEAFIRTFIGCLIETLAFHIGIMLSCYFTLSLLDRIQPNKKNTSSAPISGIRQEFRFSLIPLSLLYSSMSKLFLLFLLSIWRPSMKRSSPDGTWPEPTAATAIGTPNFVISTALSIMDDDKLDREWIIRNVLGGMSAGFGLRVILDWRPAFTIVIILAGWAFKTLAASLVSGWVGGDEQTGEAWFAYSIP